MRKRSRKPSNPNIYKYALSLDISRNEQGENEMVSKLGTIGLVLIATIAISTMGINALLTAAWTSPNLNVTTRPNLDLVVSSPDFTVAKAIYTDDQLFHWNVSLTNPNTYPGQRYVKSVTSLTAQITKNTNPDVNSTTDVVAFQYSLNNGKQWYDATYDSGSNTYTLILGVTVDVNNYCPILLHASFVNDGVYKIIVQANVS
jgi:hypothetical protein